MKSTNQIKIDIPESIMTLWSLSGMFFSTYFDSEKEMLIEYSKKKQIQKEIESLEPLSEDAEFFEKVSRGSKLLSASLPQIEQYDYLGTFLGKTDVFKKTTYSKKGKERVSFITCGVDIEHFSYLVVNAKKGIYWNGEIGNISDVYEAFRNRGIEFDNDIYKEKSDSLKELGRQLKKDYPNLIL